MKQKGMVLRLDPSGKRMLEALAARIGLSQSAAIRLMIRTMSPEKPRLSDADRQVEAKA